MADDDMSTPVANLDGPQSAASIPPPARASAGAHFPSLAAYREAYAASVASPVAWWSAAARRELTWATPFSDGEAFGGSLSAGDVRWFADGTLNACVNAVDRHVAAGRGAAPAIIWEGDERGATRTITCAQLLAEVCRVAGVMTTAGVRRGDVVAVYMPMVPELAFVMLACARLGAVHNVVFGGFSADALRDRIADANAHWVFTASEGHRGGRPIPLRSTVDTAVAQCACVKAVFVYRNGAAAPVEARAGGGHGHGESHAVLSMEEQLPLARPYCPAVPVSAEDTLFLLYTSGSTGKPKGLAHSTGGYL